MDAGSQSALERWKDDPDKPMPYEGGTIPTWHPRIQIPVAYETKCFYVNNGKFVLVGYFMSKKLFRKSSNGHAERSEASCSHRQGRSTVRARCFATLCMTAQTPFIDFLNSFVIKRKELLPQARCLGCARHDVHSFFILN